MSTQQAPGVRYRGRLAPSPTGYLHLGHARTFWEAQTRARAQRGVLLLRNEDLDAARCKSEFVAAMLEDLRWFGFVWQEGPDCGGPCGPYSQSKRRPLYAQALRHLQESGFVYPCTCSRQDVLRSLQAPHAGEDEPVYPGTCRPKPDADYGRRNAEPGASEASRATPRSPPLRGHSELRINWRFQVPDGEGVRFVDGRCGPQTFVAGKDFGDFIVWRHDGTAAYQLACVVDDAMMGITEVVRGADLLRSTARQLLLYRALGWPPPAFYHCALVKDEQGVRLAKRHDALSLRRLRAQGAGPAQLRQGW